MNLYPFFAGQILDSVTDGMRGPLDLKDDLPADDAYRMIDEAIEKHLVFMERYKNSIQALIKEVMNQHDASMRRHQASLSALKSQRNFLTPISDLPPEILCSIFAWVRDSDSGDLVEDEEGILTSKSLKIPWIQVTHVCSHWRNVALNSPELWSRVFPFRNITWLKEMLLRSKEASLSFTYNDLCDDHYARPQFRAALSHALKHANRIQHLSIYTDAFNFGKFLSAIHGSSAPRLESLRLSSSYALSKLDLPTYDPETENRKPSFDGVPNESINLRRLELNYFEASWDSRAPFLLNLTNLRLHGTTPSPDLTWQWFMDTLRAMPLLEVLDLNDSFPTCSEKEATHLSYFGSAHFNHLQRLSLSCDVREGGIILSCITFPPTTFVKFNCCFNLNIVSPVPSIDFANVFICLAQIYAKMNPKPSFQTLVLLQAPFALPGARVKLFQSALTDNELLNAHSNDLSAHLEIVYTWASRYGPRDEIADKAASDIFNSGLPLFDVRRVYLQNEIDGFVGAPDLANTIGELPELRSIAAVGSAGRDLVCAMMLEIQKEDPKIFPSYFPRLTSICFHTTRFKSLHYEDDPEFDLDYLSITLLENCLIQRHKLNLGLDKLTLRLCQRFCAAEFESLQNLQYPGDEIDIKVDIDLDWDQELVLSDPEDEYDSDYDSVDDDHSTDIGGWETMSDDNDGDEDDEDEDDEEEDEEEEDDEEDEDEDDNVDDDDT